MTIKKSGKFTFVCESNRTRNGFAHKCTIFMGDNNPIGNAKVNYVNRTWEMFDYQTVMRKATEDAITKMEKYRPEAPELEELYTLVDSIKSGDIDRS